MLRIVLLVLGAILVVAVARAVAGSWAWLVLVALILVVVVFLLGVRRSAHSARQDHSARRRY
ncbi:MAG TPA: hypothetical protein VLM11_02155 [Streptosporangiaceae bacterium]|nr:hypothetical protein [Streptosporangiaceae bacterium]